jgi:hypothetical protein
MAAADAGTGHYAIQTRNLVAEQAARQQATEAARAAAAVALHAVRRCASCQETYTEAGNLGRWLCSVHPRRRSRVVATGPGSQWGGGHNQGAQPTFVYPCCGADAQGQMDDRCRPCDHADRRELGGRRMRPGRTVIPAFLVESGDVEIPPWASLGMKEEYGHACVVVQRVGPAGSGQQPVLCR